MTDRVLVSNQLAAFCLRDKYSAIFESLNDDALDFLQRALVNTLLAEVPSNRVAIIRDLSHEDHSLASVMAMSRDAGGRPQIMVSFLVRDTAVEAALPIMGLVLAVASGKVEWTDAVSKGLETLHSIWSNISVLRTPEDADQISTLEALLQVSAEGKLCTPDVIQAHCGLDTDRVLASLNQLYERRIVTVAAWGQSQGDTASIKNHWVIRF